MSRRERCNDGFRGLLLDAPLDRMISTPALVGSRLPFPHRPNAVGDPGSLAKLTLPIGSSDLMNSPKVRARALALLERNRRATPSIPATRATYR